MKKSLKGLLSLALALLMVLSLLPTGLLSVTAYAANSTLTGLSDESIGLSYSSYDAWTADGDRIVGEASGKKLFGTLYSLRKSRGRIQSRKSRPYPRIAPAASGKQKRLPGHAGKLCSGFAVRKIY